MEDDILNSTGNYIGQIESISEDQSYIWTENNSWQLYLDNPAAERKVEIIFNTMLQTTFTSIKNVQIFVDGEFWPDIEILSTGKTKVLFSENQLINGVIITFESDVYQPLKKYYVKSKYINSNEVILIELDLDQEVPTTTIDVNPVLSDPSISGGGGSTGDNSNIDSANRPPAIQERPIQDIIR